MRYIITLLCTLLRDVYIEIVCSPAVISGVGLRCAVKNAGPLSGSVAQFYTQTAIAINPAGSKMLVADTDNSMIREIYCDGG